MKYHIDISGDQHDDFRTAYAEAIGKVIENDCSEIAIVVDDIESLDAFIYPVLRGIVSNLKTFGYTDIAGIRVYLETKDIKSKLQNGLFLASYITEDYLQTILTDTRATDTIFVTNKPEDLESYLLVNDSETLRNGL